LTEKVTGAFPSSRSTTNHLKGVATPMTDLKFALMELLRKYQSDQDVLREGLQLLAEALMELEVTQKVGAGRYERTSQRTNYRNGYRLRNWDTRVGTIALRIPRLRQGGYLPCFLEPRRRAERALLSVIQEAYVHGVSTRKVDDLVQAQGLHQVVHLPGADAVDVSLLDDGQQGPFGPPARLQEAGEVAPLPQPRDSQRNGADPGVPVPEAVPARRNVHGVRRRPSP